MSARLCSRIETMLPRVIETRHYLHQRPELSGQEEETAAFVARRLADLGLRPRTGIGGHGVYADIEGRSAGRTIALRADMDALPIQEESCLPYASERAGVMHACGHDGHTALLLAVAEILRDEMRDHDGRVRLIFQPAEETVGGALRMIKDGAMDGVDCVVALHGWRHLPLGHIGLRSGPSMAGAGVFDIEVRGRGAHAAYPHLSADPIVTAAKIVLALQTVVSREINPIEPAVLTVARMEAGTAYNIIPDVARLAGTVRTLTPETRDRIEAVVRRIVQGECAASGAVAEIAYHRGSPPVINDARVVALIRRAAVEAVGPDAVSDLVESSMGAEDFAYMIERAPGAMFRLGLGDGPAGHTSTFDFDDRALGVGIEVMCRTALLYLAHGLAPSAPAT
ncbi:MAG: amidohydrolase [Chthonomonadales bacterium]|nr:amidohydrolase [Chthonomonadales bacterium]